MRQKTKEDRSYTEGCGSETHNHITHESFWRELTLAGESNG